MPNSRPQHLPRVAVLIESSRAFGRGLIEGIARYSRLHGPWSMYFEPHELGVAPPGWLKDWTGDGIIARIDDRRMAEAVLATGLPALDLRGRFRDLDLPFIGSNNIAITRVGFEHLRERGLRRFGFCGMPSGRIRALDERRDHFVRHVTEAGFDCYLFTSQPHMALAKDAAGPFGPPGVIEPAPADWDAEQNRLAEWVLSLPRPIGILACHDPRGYQLVDACRRAGVSVPDEVAVVGVDNDPVLCSMANPPMTSIDPDGPRIGFAAAECLDRMMRGERPPQEAVTIEPRGLTARRSSDMLAIDDPEIARAVRYIRDHACRGARVDEVVHQIAMSRSVFERRFKQALGRTPKSELLRVQIERAKQLLAESDLPLATVAEQCGFSTEKYLSDAFVRVTGSRPTAFRRTIRPDLSH